MVFIAVDPPNLFIPNSTFAFPPPKKKNIRNKKSRRSLVAAKQANREIRRRKRCIHTLAHFFKLKKKLGGGGFFWGGGGKLMSWLKIYQMPKKTKLKPFFSLSLLDKFLLAGLTLFSCLTWALGFFAFFVLSRSKQQVVYHKWPPDLLPLRMIRGSKPHSKRRLSYSRLVLSDFIPMKWAQKEARKEELSAALEK